MTGCFVNYSNHPSSKWSEEQLAAANEIGTIVDILFPDVDPSATKEDITNMARESVNEIVAYDPTAVLCQGEFTLCFSVVSMLKQRGIKVVAACSKRMVEETPKGKISKFTFEQFREY